MKITAREVAEYLGVDYVVAAGLMSMFLEKGVAKHVENRKTANGKGKPTRVFEIDRVITLELAAAPQTVELPQDSFEHRADAQAFVDAVLRNTAAETEAA